METLPLTIIILQNFFRVIMKHINDIRLKLSNTMIRFPQLKQFAQGVKFNFLVKFICILEFCCLCSSYLFYEIKNSI